MAKLFKFAALALIAGICGAAVTIALHLWAPSGGPAAAAVAADVTYTDFLSITLTALAIMITVLGIFVAAAGVIGWATLENKLRDHSLAYFKEELGENGKLRSDLEKLFVDIAYNGVDNYKAQKGLSEEKDYND